MKDRSYWKVRRLMESLFLILNTPKYSAFLLQIKVYSWDYYLCGFLSQSIKIGMAIDIYEHRRKMLMSEL